MFQVRIHGRGGLGVETAAELLSVAAFRDGRHAQAFPSFGSERTGAPVVAFCRIDERPIRVREPIVEPDALIVHVLTVPATGLARRHLGRPLPNAALLGAFSAMCGLGTLDSVTTAIRERFSAGAAEANVSAARAAFDVVTVPAYA